MPRSSFSMSIVVAVCLCFAATAVRADCIRKAGEGTAVSKDGALFQAYEVILQTTSFFGVWAPWISSGGKIGEAPGYVVKKPKSRCRKGGLGYVCVYQATLCKKP